MFLLNELLLQGFDTCDLDKNEAIKRPGETPGLFFVYTTRSNIDRTENVKSAMLAMQWYSWDQSVATVVLDYYRNRFSAHKSLT